MLHAKDALSTRPQRRRAVRVAMCAPVDLVAEARAGRVRLRGTLLDLSAGGCRLLLTHPVELGTRVRSTLVLGSDQLEVRGRVVWTRARARASVVGVRFDDLSPAVKASIARAVVTIQRGRALRA